MTTNDSKRPHRVQACWLGVSMVALMAAAPAAAQDVQTGQTEQVAQNSPPSAPAPPARQASGGDQNPQSVQEIVVTAQKMGAQSILDVPMAITAYNATTLNSAGVHDLGDIAQLSPSFEFVESLGREFNYLSMRGVSSNETGTPTVQVYVDGFTTGIARGSLNTTLFGLERVEVLEGPQATLYGRNSIGGVINYITKKPGNDFESELDLEGGEYGTVQAMGRVSGPIISNELFGEVSVAYHQRDGYDTNIFTGEKGIDSQQDISARGALRAVFDQTTVDVSATYSHTNDGCVECAYIPSDYKIPLIAGLPPYDTSLRDHLVDTNEYSRDVDLLGPHFLHKDENTEVMNVEHDFSDGLVLTSISGYGEVAANMAFSLTRAASREPNAAFDTYVLSDSKDQSASEELRLSGGHEGTLQWLVGGYYAYYSEKSLTYLGYLLPNPTAVDNTTANNYAVFANAELPIGPRFALSGGLRYDVEQIDDNNPELGLSGASKSNELLPKVTAEYHFTPHVMIYATVSKGYKSGGVNVAVADVPRNFAPEFLWNYEAGLKGSLMDDRLTYALTGFHMDWTNRQVQLLDPSGLYPYSANEGTARIDGVELQSALNVGHGFTIGGALTYLNAKITRYVDSSGVSTFYGVNPNLAGNELPNAPSFRASLNPEWTTPIFDGAWDLHARADVSYTGVRFFDPQNLLRQNPYTLVNLYLGVERKNFKAGVFADNAFNQGYHDAGELTEVGPLLNTGAPRVVGVRIQAKM
jgi:iron complex outermembrane recepter protein